VSPWFFPKGSIKNHGTLGAVVSFFSQAQTGRFLLAGHLGGEAREEGWATPTHERIHAQDECAL